MNELIKITTNNQGQQLVSARELYKGLGLARTKWTPWYKKNIKNNEFFLENIDWTEVSLEVTGNETIDFAISLDFAKHIAMMARTEKSHEYRKYFIECEKKLKEIEQPKLPQTYLEALEALVESEKIKQQQAKLLEEQKPLVQFATQVSSSSDCIDIGQFAKVLKDESIKMGRNKLFGWLRDHKYLMDNNEPHQKYIDNGYFSVVEVTKQTAYGVKTYTKTLITGKGQIYILEKLRN